MHIRTGIVLTAIYQAAEAALLAGHRHTGSHYLFNLAIFLTPLACGYIGNTCLGETVRWSGKQWALAAAILLAIALGLGWMMENLLKQST